MPAPEDLCRTVVFSKEVDNDGNGSGKPYLFRTHPNDALAQINTIPGRRVTTLYGRQAGRLRPLRVTWTGLPSAKMTTAGSNTFLDGATACNDPLHELLGEVLDLEQDVSSSVMLTLGTGLKAGKRGKAGGILGKLVPRRWHQNLRVVSEKFSHDGSVRRNMEREMKYNHKGFKWYKWYSGLEVGAMGLDKSRPRHFARMNDGVALYMADEEIKKETLEVAVQLVVERRRRYKLTPDKWTRYAGATLVECPLRHRKTDEKNFGTRKQASIHVQSVHHDSEYGVDLNRIELTQPLLRGPW